MDQMGEKPDKADGFVADPSASDTSVTNQLEAMGYKSEMKRNLGMISVLGLSFAIMAVPFGTSTTLNIALTDGGPVTILYGVSRARMTPHTEGYY
jgi:hypothetical protein